MKRMMKIVPPAAECTPQLEMPPFGFPVQFAPARVHSAGYGRVPVLYTVLLTNVAINVNTLRLHTSSGPVIGICIDKGRFLDRLWPPRLSSTAIASTRDLADVEVPVLTLPGLFWWRSLGLEASVEVGLAPRCQAYSRVDCDEAITVIDNAWGGSLQKQVLLSWPVYEDGSGNLAAISAVDGKPLDITSG